MTAPREHACPLCESCCDTVTRLRLLVRDLEDECQRLAIALSEERALRSWAAAEIERRFPAEVA